jgi:hypothetical protein
VTILILEQRIGLKMFELVFHLPMLVYRESAILRSDPRLDKYGEPLRGFDNISFLGTSEAGALGVLYEAVTSLVVVGIDNFRWTAYMLVDTYFDGPDTTRETVWEYHKDESGDDGTYMDPLTRGNEAADRPQRDPRRYFFLVLQHRWKLALTEWQNTVLHVQARFKWFETVSYTSLNAQTC